MDGDTKKYIVKTMKEDPIYFGFLQTDDERLFNIGHVGMGAYIAMLSKPDYVDAVNELIQEGVLNFSDERITVAREYRADEEGDEQLISGQKIKLYGDDS